MLIRNLTLATMEHGYGLVPGGAIAIQDGFISFAGRHEDAPDDSVIIDGNGLLATPGLIDCHTHLVYGGNRAQEFEQRLNGVAYADIAKAGGGILSTVRATRAASEEELTASALARLDCLLAEGCTTVEIKSGYGLDIDTEARMLRVARGLEALRPVTVRTTYLGAHAIPPEFKEDRDAYVDLVCGKAMDTIIDSKLVDAVDVFCEGIAFSLDETRRVFKAAQDRGIPVKIHAEQLSNLGGAALAASFSALSADHIEYLDQHGIEAIRHSGTVATLLPGAFYYLRETQLPPVDGLRAGGIPMAIATDLNPGSSPIHSLLTTMNMACVLFRLTPEEALRGVTVNAARALGLPDRGRLAPGLRADIAFWTVGQPGDLAYPLGFNPLAAVIREGRLVRGSLS
jgi:imidazolonepropionase